MHANEQNIPLQSKITVRGGAEVARWAHNPKVVGSNPAPATQEKPLADKLTVFLFLNGPFCNKRIVSIAVVDGDPP